MVVQPDSKRDLQGKYRRYMVFSRLSRCILQDRRIDRIVLMNRISKHSDSCLIAKGSYCTVHAGAGLNGDTTLFAL